MSDEQQMKTGLDMAIVRLVGLVGFALLWTASCSARMSELHVSVKGGSWGHVVSTAVQMDCVSDCTARIQKDGRVDLLPAPSAAGKFLGWSGDCAGTDACSLRANDDIEVTAEFAPRDYVLHVEVEGEGAVRLPDGSDCTSACDVTTTSGQEVVFQATARVDSYFAEWSGGVCSGANPGCSFEPSEGQVVHARFGRKMRLEVAGVGPTTGGVVLGMPLDINCGAVCSAWLMPGQTITLTAAVTDDLWRFEGWSEPQCAGTTCTVLMDEDKTIEARFKSIFVWSRALQFITARDAYPTADGSFDLVVVSDTAQDFGAGRVPPTLKGRANTFLTRYDRQGQPQVTRLFGGTAHAFGTVMRRRTDGTASLALTVASSSSNASSPEYADLGGLHIEVGYGETEKAWVDLGADDSITGAGLLDPSFAVWKVVGAQTIDYALLGRPTDTTTTVARLNPDWTTDWVLQNPSMEMKLRAGKQGKAWAVTREVPAAMNCTGGPASQGALISIDEAGSCMVVWPFPNTFVPLAFAAPGGDPLVFGFYNRGFEFAGHPLPDEELPGLTRTVRLRFDEAGQPKWGQAYFVGGGSSFIRMDDAAMVSGNRVLVTGRYQGIGDLSPDTAVTDTTVYMALYSDDTGEMLWHRSFPKPPSAGSNAVFDRLIPLSDGRILLLGDFGDEFDFGGGILSAPGGAGLGLAVYDF